MQTRPNRFRARNGFLTILAIAGAVAAAGTAQAQSDMTVGAAPSTGVVVSTPVEIDADGGIAVDQRPAFREYIVREQVPAYTVRERVIVGGVRKASRPTMCRRPSVLRRIVTPS